MKIHVIDNGLFKLDGGAMFGVVPKLLWQKNNPADEDNLCTWAMRCLLIEEDKRLILIDTGCGDKQEQYFFDFYKRKKENTISKSIKEKGFSVEDITDVFLTHCHFDHCGGVSHIVNGKIELQFPHANIWTNKAHWHSVKNPNAREKASFLKENIEPMEHSGKLKFIEVKQGIDFSENIKVHFVHGHTIAMMLPEIRYKGKNILFCADLFPSTSHISLAWVMGFDSYPMKTLEEKKYFLRWGLEEDNIFFFEHDPKVECCTVHTTEKGIRVKDVFDLAMLEE